MADGTRTNTPARRKLKDWMAEAPRERSQAAVGRALKLTATSIRQWVTGWARPEVPHREALAAYTKGAVPAEEWETAKEKRERSQMLERLRAAPASP